MKSLLRLLAAFLAAYIVSRQFTGAAYWLQVAATFVAAGLAGGIVRQLFTPRPRVLMSLLPDIATPIVLAVLMLLAVRAFAHGEQPPPVVPALVWPFVDLWRPLRRGGSE